MTKPLDGKQIEALRKIDTPTICNLLEMVAPERRGTGYTTKTLNCVFPNLPPMVGYAKTATVRAKEPGPLAATTTWRFGSSTSTMWAPARRPGSA